jgi:hypothetical protein
VAIFIKRNDLVTTFSRRLDSQRAFNNDPDIVTDWLAFYRTVFQRYKIVHRNMYNFDEKGIFFGVAATARVSIGSYGQLWLPYIVAVHPIRYRTSYNPPLPTPPNSTHLLQPCDVGIFEPLQAAYGRLVDSHCRGGRSGVNKESFLVIFSEAKRNAFTTENISSAWRGTGLVPYYPTAVLKRLPT